VAMAMTLACGYLGMKNQIKPKPEMRGDAYLSPYALPRSLGEAGLMGDGSWAMVHGSWASRPQLTAHYRRLTRDYLPTEGIGLSKTSLWDMNPTRSAYGL